MTERPSFLDVKNVRKSYGAIRAVDGVTFSVGPGEIVGVIGPNGSGKTTLFNSILGQIEPTSGSVEFCGEDITGMLSDTAASARSWEQTSRENKSYASYPDEDCYVVVGTDGSLAIPTMRLRTYRNADERSWWRPFETQVLAVEDVDPLARQLAHFCAVIRDEAAPLVPVRDGLQNLRVTEAIAQAAKSGRLVEVA